MCDDDVAALVVDNGAYILLLQLLRVRVLVSEPIIGWALALTSNPAMDYCRPCLRPLILNALALRWTLC